MPTKTRRRDRPRKHVAEVAGDQEWQSNDEQREADGNGTTRQKFIEGTEPLTIPEIDKAAEEFVNIRNDWQERGEEMQKANGLLLELMKAHGLQQYNFDSQLVKVEVGEKVKVNRVKEPKPVSNE